MSIYTEDIPHHFIYVRAISAALRRCCEAGIPQEHIEFHRKHDLALQLVIQARLQGVDFSWVGADSLYGEDPSFPI